ncbi:hypothetical protein DINM_006463 [Dirofilaria immitis]|nr:hypothetical protein [Dirofilaria immitis]
MNEECVSLTKLHQVRHVISIIQCREDSNFIANICECPNFQKIYKWDLRIVAPVQVAFLKYVNECLEVSKSGGRVWNKKFSLALLNFIQICRGQTVLDTFINAKLHDMSVPNTYNEPKLCVLS